ncbi:MAG: valine--tRNA ligase, partial [Mycobacteriaceae bacterium]
TEPDEAFAPTASVQVRLQSGTVLVELDTSGAIDVAAERRRLAKELSTAEKELTVTSAKLASTAFTDRAPTEVVEGIRARQGVARTEIERVSARLAGLGPA